MSIFFKAISTANLLLSFFFFHGIFASNRTTLTDLPSEILQNIQFPYLTYQESVRLRQTCKRLAITVPNPANFVEDTIRRSFEQCKPFKFNRRAVNWFRSLVNERRGKGVRWENRFFYVFMMESEMAYKQINPDRAKTAFNSLFGFGKCEYSVKIKLGLLHDFMNNVARRGSQLPFSENLVDLINKYLQSKDNFMGSLIPVTDNRNRFISHVYIFFAYGSTVSAIRNMYRIIFRAMACDNWFDARKLKIFEAYLKISLQGLQSFILYDIAILVFYDLIVDPMIPLSAKEIICCSSHFPIYTIPKDDEEIDPDVDRDYHMRLSFRALQIAFMSKSRAILESVLVHFISPISWSIRKGVASRYPSYCFMLWRHIQKISDTISLGDGAHLLEYFTEMESKQSYRRVPRPQIMSILVLLFMALSPMVPWVTGLSVLFVLSLPFYQVFPVHLLFVCVLYHWISVVIGLSYIYSVAKSIYRWRQWCQTQSLLKSIVCVIGRNLRYNSLDSRYLSLFVMILISFSNSFTLTSFRLVNQIVGGADDVPTVLSEFASRYDPAFIVVIILYTLLELQEYYNMPIFDEIQDIFDPRLIGYDLEEDYNCSEWEV